MNFKAIRYSNKIYKVCCTILHMSHTSHFHAGNTSHLMAGPEGAGNFASSGGEICRSANDIKSIECP